VGTGAGEADFALRAGTSNKAEEAGGAAGSHPSAAAGAGRP